MVKFRGKRELHNKNVKDINNKVFDRDIINKIKIDAETGTGLPGNLQDTFKANYINRAGVNLYY